MSPLKFVFNTDDTGDTEVAESLTGKTKLQHYKLTGEVLGGFHRVYNEFGYGFLEKPYANALSLDLRTRGLLVEREVPIEIQYLGQPVGLYRMDMVVERRVVVEVKASAVMSIADERQLFNYLRASKFDLGLLLHFGPKPRFKRFTFAPIDPR